jgi:LPXTG-motif cell wall-anchored protein
MHVQNTIRPPANNRQAHRASAHKTKGIYMRKLTLAAAALAVVAAMVAAPAAFADDAPPPTDTAAVVTETPEVDTSVPVSDTETAKTPTAEAVAPAPEPAAPVVEQQAPEQKSAVTQQRVAPATKPQSTPVQVSWVLPEGQAPTGDYTTPGKGSIGEAGFPQVRVGTEGAATCGRWVQTDMYPSQKVADSFGDTLEYKEDWGSSSDWTFAKQADCAPPVVACVATGNWYTEDTAPTLTEDGLLFQGTGAGPINWLHPVTGNLAGIQDASYTLAGTAGYQPGYRIVVNPNAGSLHYASITFEPYFNGGAPDQSGTFSISQSSLVWSSKIASGPGSQSQPVPLSQFSTIWPDNALISIGVHLGSANPSTTKATLTAISGCVSASFTPSVPPEQTGSVTGSDSPQCVLDENGANTGDSTTRSYSTPWTNQPVWDQASSSYVFIDANRVFGETTYTTSEPVPNADCPPPVLSGSDPASQQFCTQPKDGTLTTVATETPWTQAPVFTEGAWGLADKVYGEPTSKMTITKDATCAVTIVKPKPSQSATPAERAAAEPLAETGIDGNAVALVAGYAALLAFIGGGLVLVTRRRKNS